MTNRRQMTGGIGVESGSSLQAAGGDSLCRFGGFGGSGNSDGRRRAAAGFAVLAALAILATGGGLAACGSGDKNTLWVFGASSLSEVLKEMESTYESENPDVSIRLQFAGSSRLAIQISEGAPADIFISASEKIAAGLDADVETKDIFAYGELVIAFSAGNPKNITSLESLGDLIGGAGSGSGGSALGSSGLGGSNLGSSGLGGSGLGDSNLGNSDLGNSDLGNSDLGNSDLGDSNLNGSGLGGSGLGNASLGGSAAESEGSAEGEGAGSVSGESNSVAKGSDADNAEKNTAKNILLGLCAADVPCGELADNIAAELNVKLKPATREPSARALLTKLELGEIDAALLYKTDIEASWENGEGNSSRKLDFLPINASANKTAYVLVRITDGAAAKSFRDFTLSPAGQRIMADAGFETADFENAGTP